MIQTAVYWAACKSPFVDSKGSCSHGMALNFAVVCFCTGSGCFKGHCSDPVVTSSGTIMRLHVYISAYQLVLGWKQDDSTLTKASFEFWITILWLGCGGSGFLEMGRWE